MTWTIPNILTILRLISALGIAVIFVVFDHPFANWLAICVFVLAAMTDYADGRLARAWGQESHFGRMLDPIADKAMVIIALAVIVGLTEINPLILLPVSLILLREVFVSGLREFLGARASSLRVTPLAKWKTTIQMIAIPVLFAADILRRGDAFFGTPWLDRHMEWWLHHGGIVLIWLAGGLTFVTGLDYFLKALPLLKDPNP